MPSNLPIRMLFEPQRSLAFGAIGVGYMGVGTAVNNPIRQFLIQNLTDVTLQFSFNGIDDHFPLPSNGFFLSDVMSNKSDQVGGFFLSQGDRLYVKQLGVPTLGAVYFSVIYGRDVA